MAHEKELQFNSTATLHMNIILDNSTFEFI